MKASDLHYVGTDYMACPDFQGDQDMPEICVKGIDCHTWYIDDGEYLNDNSTNYGCSGKVRVPKK